MFHIGVSSVNSFTIGYKASISCIMKIPYPFRWFSGLMNILPIVSFSLSRKRSAPPIIIPFSTSLKRWFVLAIFVWNVRDLYSGGPPVEDAPTRMSLSKARLDMPFSIRASDVLAFENIMLIILYYHLMIGTTRLYGSYLFLPGFSMRAKALWHQANREVKAWSKL